MKGACRRSEGSERSERRCVGVGAGEWGGGGRRAKWERVRRDSVNFGLSRSSAGDVIGHNACKLGLRFEFGLGF